MKRALAWLLIALQLACGPVWATDRYVSNTAANGIPVGLDANAGTIAAPKLTLAAMIAAAVAGDRIFVNDGTYAEAGGWFPNKSLEIRPVVAGNTTLQATSGNQVIVLNGPTSAVITIGAFILNATAPDTTHRLRCLYAQDNSSNPYTITLDGTKCRGDPTTDGIRIGSAGASKITFTSTDIDVTTTSAQTIQSGIYFQGQTGGSISMTRTTSVLGSHNTATLGALYINIAAADIPVTLDTATLGLTLTSGLTGTSRHYAGRVVNGNPVNVSNFTITASDNGTTRSVYGFQATPDTTTPFTQVATLTDITANMDAADSIGIIVGQDGSTGADTYNPGSTITRPTVTGTTRNESASAHGVLMGASADQKIIGAKTSGTYLGAALKRSTGASCVINGRFRNFKGYAITLRGTDGACAVNNDIYWPAGSTYQAAYGLYNWADGATVAANSVYENNILHSDTTLTNAFIYSENDGSTATYDRNSYSTANGTTLPATPWRYAGSTYATKALWLAAGRETTAYEINPRWVNAANDDFYLRAPRLMRAGKVQSLATTDAAGNPYLNPPSVGALQSHTAGGRR